MFTVSHDKNGVLWQGLKVWRSYACYAWLDFGFFSVDFSRLPKELDGKLSLTIYFWKWIFTFVQN